MADSFKEYIKSLSELNSLLPGAAAVGLPWIGKFAASVEPADPHCAPAIATVMSTALVVVSYWGRGWFVKAIAKWIFGAYVAAVFCFVVFLFLYFQCVIRGCPFDS